MPLGLATTLVDLKGRLLSLRVFELAQLGGVRAPSRLGNCLHKRLCQVVSGPPGYHRALIPLSYS